MDIHIREDGEIELDMWGRHIAAGRKLRPGIWDRAMATMEEAGKAPGKEVEPIRELFVDLRIDLERAMVAIEAGCDAGVIPIDPRPESGDEQTNAALRDEMENHTRIMKLVFSEIGRDEIDHFDPDDAALVDDARRRLQEANALRPGVLGV